MNAYYNGIFCNYEDVSVPLTDRCIFFGDGIYDACIGRNGKIFMLEEHLERFFGNANALELYVDFDNAFLTSIFEELTGAFGNGCFFLYFQLTRNGHKRAHAPSIDAKSNLLVTISPLDFPTPERRLKLIFAEDNRYELCNIKTLNLLPSVLASAKAVRCGADEAVFVRRNTVTECAHSNVHIVKSGKVITHPKNKFILPGISRAHLLSVCDRLSIEKEERCFTKEELLSADEVIVTSTSKICARASVVDNVHYPLHHKSTAAIICHEMFSDFYSSTL